LILLQFFLSIVYSNLSEVIVECQQQKYCANEVLDASAIGPAEIVKPCRKFKHRGALGADVKFEQRIGVCEYERRIGEHASIQEKLARIVPDVTRYRCVKYFLTTYSWASSLSKS